jgi:flagellin
MRINTNVSAINAHRNLTQTQSALGASMQKLSSGFRINRAADDAAGLGIANILRAATRSLVQGARNAEQANSLLQIAEGSTATIQKMLERMKELATQAGSASVDVAGRERIDAEYQQLLQEITRTVDTTTFQGGFLLKTVEAQDAVEAVAASEHTAAALTVAGTGNGTAAATGTYEGSGETITITRAGGAWLIDDGGDPIAFNSGDTFQGIEITITDGGTAWADGDTLTLAVTAGVEAQDAVEASGGPRSFLVSSSGAYTTDDLITIQGIDLRLETLELNGTNLLEAASARDVLTTIDNAMATVNETLGQIGAAQNRVEYAVDNVRTTIQNFAAAESVIRDVDMAEEMTNFSKNNILAQAGTAMLAQANQSAQNVLQLLRG